MFISKFISKIMFQKIFKLYFRKFNFIGFVTLFSNIIWILKVTYTWNANKNILTQCAKWTRIWDFIWSCCSFGPTCCQSMYSSGCLIYLRFTSCIQGVRISTISGNVMRKTNSRILWNLRAKLRTEKDLIRECANQIKSFVLKYYIAKY